MDTVLNLQANITSLVFLALLAVGVFAFVNSLLWSGASYEAAGKLNKRTWNIILGLALGVQLLLGLGILGVAAIVAAFVYLADVRPALSSLQRR